MHIGSLRALLVSAAVIASPAAAQDHMDHHMGHEGMTATPPRQAAAVKKTPTDHDTGAMTGALGSYRSGREASGTSWQSDVSPHAMGVMAMRGSWMLMGHATLNGVYDWQGGSRGDEKAFVSGMIMGMARRDFTGGDTVQFRAMISPDPLMGKSGYPLLLASGETADGKSHLVDRQHPHDFLMELSASYAHRLSDKNSLYLYAGLPGEPAFGPPAFMHRLSAMDSPEAPISHHWLDSTHITFGVVTMGFVHANWKLEASRFTGREPDQRRYDIEEPRLDSTAVRISWNPTERLALQASWARLNSPEALEPDKDERRWSASAIYTAPIGAGGWWSTTFAVGVKKPIGGARRIAWAAESALHPNEDWTFFGRAERVETDELFEHGAIEDVAKASLGVIRDFQIHDHLTFGVGALYTRAWISDALEAAYGGDQNGAMAFVRFKIR